MNDEYDVNQYTEAQLFNILNVNNPSDRELEAKIISMIRKYRNFENSDGDKLAKFFEDIYDFFFETTEETEGFATMASAPDWENLQVLDTDTYEQLYGNNDRKYTLNDSNPLSSITDVNGVLDRKSVV